MPIDPGEFRHVQPDTLVRTSFAVGESVMIAGVVDLGILGGDGIACVIWPHEGGSDGRPWELGQECDRIVVGRFSVSFTFQHAGPYTLAVWLTNGRSGGLELSFDGFPHRGLF